MRLLVAAITFGITVGGLFLFENYKTAPEEKDYAQIVQGLTPSLAISRGTALPTELANQPQIKTPAPKPANNSSKTSTKNPTPSPVPSFTATSIATPSPAPLTPLPTPTPTPTVMPSAESTPTPTPTPTPQPTQQNDQITIAFLTSPVEQNSTAQLDIKTVPEAQCAIKVTLPSGSQSTAKGLETKLADNSGTITWSWKINWNTTPGTANIDLTCSKNEQSFSKSLQMEITVR
ncbi:MAG: hypothetical protein HYT65_00995 [Candidatus Yanofskybacteria bacterium]|nr:hypothetical protein [Candidatus Yanofskybacteria bacterium]